MAGGADPVVLLGRADLDLDLPGRGVSCAEVLMYVSLDSLDLTSGLRATD